MKLRANEATPRGFTLIELLVVIAIIGVLASVIIASLGTARDKARDAAIIENMLSLRTTAALYYSENGSYAANNSNFTKNDCPNPGGSLTSIFHTGGGPIASQINSLIQQTELLYGGSFPGVSAGKCASNATNYAIAIPMSTQEAAPSIIQYFCIDSEGFAKIGVHTPLLNSINSSVRCRP